MSTTATTTTTTATTTKIPMKLPADAVAEVEAEVEQFRRQAYLRRGLSYPGPSPSSTARVAAGAPIQDDRQPKSFSQLLEDFIRTHSSTASPAGQRYASDMLQGTIGRRRVFGGGYIGSFS